MVMGLSALKHKRILKYAFSDCFMPFKDELGNVPVTMQVSKMITASIIGICRGYAEGKVRSQSDFDLIVDAVFEEIFRRESVEVQTRAQAWLEQSDDEFMKFYYQAKHKARYSDDIDWLQTKALNDFKANSTVVFPL